MKHIIEKHVTTATFGNEEPYRSIEADSFPALISDLEAEWCKAIEWSARGRYLPYFDDRTRSIEWSYNGYYYTTAELLKIYQNENTNRENLP